MSATNSNHELDADREASASEGPPTSAASPGEIEPPEPKEPEPKEPEPTDAETAADIEETDAPEPASGTALSDDPILSTDPELPNEHAPTATSAPEFTTAPADLNAHPNIDETPDRNWLGCAAFITGALGLSVGAIALGHLGLSAAKQGRAAHRDFALAGLILGYIALVATVAGLWFLSTDRTPPASIDVQAQQDVSAVGAAAAIAAVDSGQTPEVTLTDTGYVVGGQTIDTHLVGERTLSLTGDGMAGWCLEIGYEGGEQPAFSYTATTGMAQGRCAPLG